MTPRMTPRMTPARILRLCLKELRESLRDRRTIVTLVLMPLLVYPLLSLVLNRVLLTSLNGSQAMSSTIGIGVELKGSPILQTLRLGYTLLHNRESSPIYIEDPVQDGQLAKKGVSEIVDLPSPQLLVLSDNGRSALRDGSVDVVITRKVPQDSSNPAPESVFERQAERIRNSGLAPDGFDPEVLLALIGNYEVRYRQGDQQSERALAMVERMLGAVNQEASRGLIGMSYQPPFRLRATPVIMKSNYADLLATMVPLVLVLMTMAGAVYPAIDLTAGERERGTMEALIVSPTPHAVILFAKYSAVVMVALLTALANLTAMSITLWVSGIGKMIFGDGILSPGVMGTILVLLVLFTMFFAAMLLAVTSFAKSFKEAQAYLIPLMLLALTPGVLSLLPGIKFSGLLATVPLVNIVLLARQILNGQAEWNTAMVAVICNCVYAFAGLAVAAKLFGNDASMQGSQGSWRDLIMRPREYIRVPRLDQMAMTMAVMFPLYFIASSALPRMSESFSFAQRLWISAGISYVLILLFPLLVNWYQRIQFAPTYRLSFGTPRSWLVWLPAILLTGCSAWMAAHEIFILGQTIGIGTIEFDQMERVLQFKRRLQMLPLALILFVFALTPAICEEFLFRGFILSSLSKSRVWWAIFFSSVMFGLMHVLTSNVLAVERFLPSAFMGIILGLIAYRTGSIWPGVLVHALHNGLLLSMTYYQGWLKRANILVEEGTHLPATWLGAGGAMLLIGVALFWFLGSPRQPLSQTRLDNAVPEPA